MIRVFIVLLLIIVSFFGGIFYQRQDQRHIVELNKEISQLQKQSTDLKNRNEELKETFKLVKRQIQTDRIAYKTLQEVVENSDSEQEKLRHQLEKQRKLLQSLQDN